MAQRRRSAARLLGRRPAETGRAKAVVAMAALGVVAALGVARVGAASTFEVDRSSEPAQTQAPAPSSAAAPAATFVVHVDGAVAHPGVYTLSGSSVRVADAVSAAGGLAEDAATDGVNLAALVVDGSKVHIPHAADASQAVSAASAGSPSVDGAASPGLVNINTADASALDSLPGVGASTASAIIEDRERNGPFTSVEDLMRVSGIGEKKFEKLRELVCV